MAWGWEEGQECSFQRGRGNLRGDGCASVLIVVIVLQVFTYARLYQMVPITYVQFVVCHLLSIKVFSEEYVVP